MIIGGYPYMSNKTPRNSEYTSCLKDFICKEYNFNSINFTPAKRGFYGETWRLDTCDNSYFIKLVYFEEHKEIYKRSFKIVEHLCNHGIDFISRIIKTAGGRLYTHFDGAILGVFNWIDGENIETDETKTPEFQMLARVYTVSPCNILIPREDFSGKSADDFFRQWKKINNTQVNLLLEKNRTMLEYRAERLKYFSELCKGDTTGFYITHGDAGRNFVVDGDKNFIVDWDSSLLAPPERDAWEAGFQDWARCLFNKSLRQNGIDYTLRAERLAYYSYYVFFYCLYWDIQYSQADEIEDFFNGYGEERIEYADKLFNSNVIK